MTFVNISGMGRLIFIAALIASNTLSTAAHAEVLLTGRNITPAFIVRIADGEPVAIAACALSRVEEAHKVLIRAAGAGQKIYGLTTGVGVNKDREGVIFGSSLPPDVIAASRKFNVELILAHSGSVGADMSVRTVRAVMAVRLNMLLNGGGGVQREIVETYAAFLNAGIAPAMPSGGSVGQSDITILSHVGLAMLGKGDVYYDGRKMPAAQALQMANIKPIRPFGKDALAILSSNAYSAGMAALALHEIRHLQDIGELVFALSLQAFNGNVSPFLQASLDLRPFPHVVTTGERLRHLMVGSSLWRADAQRALQDPLSYRSGVYLLAELARSIADAERLLQIQINSSDDNPGVIVGTQYVDASHGAKASASKAYAHVGGAVLPTANFDSLPWIVSFEQLSIALAHYSFGSAQRIVSLNNPNFTGLSRYLGTDQTVHAFGAMEKPVTSLATENHMLAAPASLHYFPVAQGIEDIATNAPLVVQRLQKQIDNSYVLMGLEVIHAAQAADLREAKSSHFVLAPHAERLRSALRNQVPFLLTDRPMTADFRVAEQLVRQYRD